MNQVVFEVVIHFCIQIHFDCWSVDKNTCTMIWNVAFFLTKFVLTLQPIILKKEILVLFLKVLLNQTSCAFPVIANLTFHVVYDEIVMVIMFATLCTYKRVSLRNQLMIFVVFYTLRNLNLISMFSWFLVSDQFVKYF